MPWDKFTEDGQICIYKVDDDGHKVGKTLGCHDSEKDANAQLAALYANEPEAGRSKGMNLWQRVLHALRAIVRDVEAAPEAAMEERAVAMDQIWEQVWAALDRMAGDENGFPWLNDIYLDNGLPVAIISKSGKLYRAPIAVDGSTATLGAMTEVEIQFAQRGQSALMVRKQPDGTHRWFAIVCSAVLNRVGEIDSRALFDSFKENVKTEGYPVLRFYHDPRLDFGQADWLDRDGDLLLASGTFDEEHPLARAFIDASEKGRGRWGISHGFEPTAPAQAFEVADGVTIPVYVAGICREISVLPEDRAAAWYTAINTEVTRMRKEIKDALVELFGDEGAASEFAEQVDQRQREIDERGLITRDGDGEATDASTEPAPTTEDVAEPEAQTAPEGADAASEPEPESAPENGQLPPLIQLDDAAMAALVNQVIEGVDARYQQIEAKLAEIEARVATIPAPPDLAPVTEALGEVRSRLELLERSDEEKQRTWLADRPARANVPVATYRPREANAPAPPAELNSDQRAASVLAKLHGVLDR